MAAERVSGLLRHLRGSNAAAQQRAVDALAQLVSDSAEDLQALVAGGGLADVLRLLWSSDSHLVQAAALKVINQVGGPDANTRPQWGSKQHRAGSRSHRGCSGTGATAGQPP